MALTKLMVGSTLSAVLRGEGWITNLDDYDFTVSIYSEGMENMLSKLKSDCERVSENMYKVVFSSDETKSLPTGQYTLEFLLKSAEKSVIGKQTFAFVMEDNRSKTLL